MDMNAEDNHEGEAATTCAACMEPLRAGGTYYESVRLA
jgi:hypothetical protein